MDLDYKWTLDMVKSGYSAEQIELMANEYLKVESKKDLIEKICCQIGDFPLWHHTKHLSDEDVVEAFTEVGNLVVQAGRHRRR